MMIKTRYALQRGLLMEPLRSCCPGSLRNFAEHGRIITNFHVVTKTRNSAPAHVCESAAWHCSELQGFVVVARSGCRIWMDRATTGSKRCSPLHREQAAVLTGMTCTSQRCSPSPLRLLLAPGCNSTRASFLTSLSLNLAGLYFLLCQSLISHGFAGTGQ